MGFCRAYMFCLLAGIGNIVEFALSAIHACSMLRSLMKKQCHLNPSYATTD